MCNLIGVYWKFKYGDVNFLLNEKWLGIWLGGFIFLKV